MGVVGESSACAQLDARQQLHAAGKHGLLRGVSAVDEHKREGGRGGAGTRSKSKTIRVKDVCVCVCVWVGGGVRGLQID